MQVKKLNIFMHSSPALQHSNTAFTVPSHRS